MRRALAGLVLAAAAVSAAPHALAHGGGVLDLEGLEVLAAARAASETGPAGRAWRALGRVLAREVRRPLVDEIAKLRAAALAAAGPLVGDAELDSLIVAGVGAAGVALDEEPEHVAAVVRGLERAADRDRVARLVARAERKHAEGAAFPAGETWRRLRRWVASAADFARAKSFAQTALVRQARRRAPGQPVPKGARGTIATYAGSGQSAAGTEGLPALVAPFYSPQDAAIDPATGLVHVVDWNNHRVRRIDADGRVRTVMGNGTGFLDHPFGPALDADLHHPTGIAFHPATDDLFVAAWHQSRLLRLDRASGNVEHVTGDGTLGFAGDGGPAADGVVDYPCDLVFAADGTLYFFDQGNRRVRCIDPAGLLFTLAGTGAGGFSGDGGPGASATLDATPGLAPATELTEPGGRLALAPDGGTLYVADTGNRRVRAIDLGAQFGRIATFAGTGESMSSGDGGPAESASFLAPVDVECDAQGNVLVCDRDAAVVRRIDAITGIVTTIAGTGTPGFSGDGGPATDARLRLPSGICVDRVRGRVYVADTGNHVIRVVWE